MNPALSWFRRFLLPGITGTVILLALIGFLAFKGTSLIEGVLSVWSIVPWPGQS